MTLRRRLLALGVAASTMTTAIAACNTILGVADVKLKSPDGGDLPPDDPNIPFDPDVPIDGHAPSRPNIFQVALGEQHSCARKTVGLVKCWGDDLQGQVGSVDPPDGGTAIVPVDVNINDAVDIAAGRNHTCVARSSGKVSCWGYNLDGQLGNATSGNSSQTPVDAKLTSAIAVAAGGNFSCAIRLDGTVACWGGNASGQLGRGDSNPSTTPVGVAKLQGAIGIAAGQAHACAVNGDGGVMCWGDGANGQLGQGTADGSPSPVAVDQLPEATMVSATERSTCALTRDKHVYCWGANELGQLGTGAPNMSPNPRPIVVANLSDVVSIGSGRNHTCAVRADGSVACWGAASRGQLGDGVSIEGGGVQASLVVAKGVGDAVWVAGGGEHSCATTRAGAILCWGANDRGQLGNASMEGAPTPVNASGYP